MEERVLAILADLKAQSNELEAKYRAVALLTGLTRRELEELGGF